MRIRRCVSVLLALALLASLAPAWAADGFSNDADRINAAARSVLKLEVYDRDNDLIKTGSGFVAFDNRHLVTNYHVADEADKILAYSDTGDPYIIFDVCIGDSVKDIAILQFFSPTDLAPLELNEEELKRATPVVAIGSPKAFSNAVSTGIIGSIFEEGGCSYIQFTAPISSGSSGGALFNDSGRVIGITSMAYDDGKGVNQNLNIAVNSAEVISLYRQWNGETRSLADLRDVDAGTKAAAPATPEPFSGGNEDTAPGPGTYTGAGDDGNAVGFPSPQPRADDGKDENTGRNEPAGKEDDTPAFPSDPQGDIPVTSLNAFDDTLDWEDDNILTVFGAMAAMEYILAYDEKETAAQEAFLASILAGDTYLLKENGDIILIFPGTDEKCYFLMYNMKNESLHATVRAESAKTAYDRISWIYTKTKAVTGSEMNLAMESILDYLKEKQE